MKNIVAVLAEAGGAPHHLARLTWYVIDKADYLARRKEIGEAYRRVIGRHFPAMTSWSWPACWKKARASKSRRRPSFHLGSGCIAPRGRRRHNDTMKENA